MDGNDGYLEKQLSAPPHKEEALAWLQIKDGKDRTVGDGSLDAARSLRLVRDLYQRGAEVVTAIDIDADAHTETTSTLIVKLPEDAAARKKLFQVNARIARQGGFDPDADAGQKYFMLHW